MRAAAVARCPSTRTGRARSCCTWEVSAITAVVARSGAVRFQEAGAVPSRDWSVLYAATNDGISTTLRTLDPATGTELASRAVPGVFTVRVVSEDGAAVALAPPVPEGFDTYHPTSKDPTPLVIVRRDDPEPQVLSVPGNVEPEGVLRRR